MTTTPTDPSTSASRVALVTGGTGDIGRATCLRAAEAGFDVAFTFHSDQEGARRLSLDLDSLGVASLSHRLDLTDEDHVRDLATRVLQHFGRLDAVVHASGPVVPQLFVSKVDTATFDRHLTLEAMAFFNLLSVVLPALRESSGAIVAVTTAANRRFYVKDILSAAPKAAIESLVRAVAMEEARYGIRANAIGPGVLEEGLVAHQERTGDTLPADFAATVVNAVPMRRLARADDIAHAACFLISDRATYITGQTIDIDGGYSL